MVTIWAGVSKVPSSIPGRTFFPPSLLPYLAASPRSIYVPYHRKLTLHEIKVLEINATSINANLMENDFRIKKINAKDEVEFHTKRKLTRLRHSWTNLFQHWMQKNPKLNKTELTSLLTATTLKMNSKYCIPSP